MVTTRPKRWTWCLALGMSWAVSVQAQGPAKQIRSVPRPQTAPAQMEPRIAKIIAQVEATTDGDVRVVDCRGLGEYKTIQGAIDEATDGDVVLVLPSKACEGGAYFENISFLGKAITVRSINPQKRDTVQATVINGSRPSVSDMGSVVTFNNGETVDAILAGFTITGGIGNGNYDGDECFGRNGGGIYVYEAAATISHCIITGNVLGDCGVEHQHRSGGGIFSYQGTLNVVNTIIKNNWTSPPDDGNLRGGGIAATFSTLSLKNTHLFKNVSDEDGGAIYAFHTTITMTNCSLLENQAINKGGGLLQHRESVTINNGIVWGNTASKGEAIYLSGSASNPISTSLVIDYTDLQGGQEAIYETSPEDEQVQWGCGNINLDPLFVDPENDDFHLTLLSPARNAGDPDHFPAKGETDIDGDPRVQEGRIDMGADEYVLEAP